MTTRPLCLQCRRRRAVPNAEIHISDGHVTWWHQPQICSWCMRVLSATLECYELGPFTRNDDIQLQLVSA